MSTEELTAAVKEAFRHLNEPEKLSKSQLLPLPGVATKKFCTHEGCIHDHEYNCLALTIKCLVETRIKSWRNRDVIWQGCILLELHRVYPASVSRFMNITIEDLVKLNSNAGLSLNIANVVDHIEQNLLDNHSLLSLFGSWPRVSKIHNLMRLARCWLVEQFQNVPADIIVIAQELLKNQYSTFTTFIGETIDFVGWHIMPQFKLRGSKNEDKLYTLEEILGDRPAENIYVYGPAGAGKTVLYRYAVWLLSSRYPLTRDNGLSNQFPVPIDCALLGRYLLSSSNDLITLAIEQWRHHPNELAANTPRLTNDHWLQLSSLLKGANLRLVIDNWDWLSFSPSSRSWHSILMQGLKDYPFVIFSRRREPWQQYGKKMRIYDLVGYSEEQIQRFIFKWQSDTNRLTITYGKQR